MGLIGFVADEIQRRRKEIAIRKVNGAETADILALISRNIMLVAIPAVAVGAAAASTYRVNHRLVRRPASTSYKVYYYYIVDLHCQRTFGALHRRLQMVCPVTLPLHRHR